ncbi:MAG: DUF294 nucleotidyltransferase-like domain-containing protein [Bacteroidales bacterium]|nr:DUF294 nucleotidyltransferase-like domain-containing protein [Bacteroidales bacterium]MCF8458246.1 DUF294 nucleotidyltransferase-like domain-containing protein [Bacteroidales bacterium]
MLTGNLKKFYISIVVPSFLTIVLFIVSIYALVIPSFERNMMERKKEMIRELTNIAWSLANEYHTEASDSLLSMEKAKILAAEKIGNMHYGSDQKDYLWITDMQPVMVMHPYRKDLIGKGLSDYQDPNGKKLFLEAVDTVAQSGHGYIDYFWQWKDDSTRIVPKLSYVKAFKPWGWIIGTGIYLEDVKVEILGLEKQLLRMSSFIALVICFLLYYIIRQSLKIERKRKEAENELLLSRQKYKSLVEASTEGTLMMLEEQIIFANLKMADKLECNPEEILVREFGDLFELSWEKASSQVSRPNKSINYETRIKYGINVGKEVILSISKIDFNNQNAFIIILKDVTRQKQFEKETDQLSYKLQSSLLLMNQPIKNFAREILYCSSESTILEAAQLMVRKNRKELFIRQNDQLIGTLSGQDLAERVLAKGMSPDKPVISVMSAPVEVIPEKALLFEAVLLCRQKGLSHLALADIQGQITGLARLDEMTNLEHNSTGFMIHEVEDSETTGQVRAVYQRLPVLIKALIDSGANAYSITRVTTSLADAITKKIIELSIEEIGLPPCRFAFLVLGSEGRMEQSLVTDQDNAIVFEDEDLASSFEAKSYFQKLANKVNHYLDYVGYDFCKGNIMARNPEWTQNLATWKTYFTNWLKNSDPQSILDATIFFDFRCLYGEQEFVDELNKHIQNEMKGKAVFFHHLSQSVMKFKPPINLFGNIVGDSESGEKPHIDLKKLIFPIVGFARIYSLKNNLAERNTPERYEKLLAQKYINRDLFVELRQSYDFLMLKRFKAQVDLIMKNKKPDNMLNTADLTEIEKGMLKKIMSDISLLQTQLNFDFKGTA